MTRFQAVALVLGCLSMVAPTVVTPTHASAKANPLVSVEQVEVEAGGRQLLLVIWKPTSPPGEGLTPLASTGAQSTPRRPLVVISHGTGAGPTAHIDTAEALAAAGFVVAAPMHRGDNFQDDSNVGRPAWMVERSQDISMVLDYMLQGWSSHAELDGKRIGIFGFSAGATTALISAGGIPELDRIASHCAVQREFVCNIMQTKPLPAAPPRWVHDSRIRAAVLAAPGLGFAFEPSGLDAVKIPIQLWVGGADQTVPSATNADVVRRLLRAPVDFRSEEKAAHLSFLAPCASDGPPQICQDDPGFDRTKFHGNFNRIVTAFFKVHLVRSKP